MNNRPMICAVVLRNGMKASYQLYTPEEISEPFVLIGSDEDGYTHTWKRDGKEFDDGKESPFDIVGLSTPDGLRPFPGMPA